jgi:hypothetical protein
VEENMKTWGLNFPLYLPQIAEHAKKFIKISSLHTGFGGEPVAG